MKSSAEEAPSWPSCWARMAARGVPRTLALTMFVLTLGVRLAFGQEESELDRLLDEEPEETEQARPRPSEPAPKEPARPKDEEAEAPERAQRRERGEPEGPPSIPGREAPPSSPAPRAARRRPIEEIVVTAQKKEQRLVDVPISISVLDGEFVNQQSITDFQDLGHHVPNTRFDVGGGGGATQTGGMRPSIRGFSTDPTIQSFEPPIGLVIDGVPYGRLTYFETAFFDVDRIEVLRGPQGTLFGKNTSVGLLNIATTRPTDEFTGFIDVERGELDRQRIEGAIGGPLMPGIVNFRVAGLNEERDGFLANTTAQVDPRADKRLVSRDRRAYRMKVDFPDVVGARLGIGYERFDLEGGGLNSEFRRVNQDLEDYYRQYDPNVDFEPDNFVASVSGQFLSMAEINSVVANGSYDLAGWGLQAVAGWSVLESASGGDITAAPDGGWDVRFGEETSQYTVEGVVNSPSLGGLFGVDHLLGFPLGSSDFTSGVFYQLRRSDPITNVFRFDQVRITELLLIQQGVFSPPGPGRPDPTRPRPGDDEPTTERIDTVYEEESNAVGIFTQMNWNLAERWTLMPGMRFSHESKDAHWVQRLSENAVLSRSTGATDFIETLDHSESHFTPRVGVTYDWTDDVVFFASRAEGFKAGGFNSLAFTNVREAALRVDSESVVSWELGSRLQLVGGTTRLNVALFNMNVKDLQLSTDVRGDLPVFSIPATVNVGEARARGIEADVDWIPTSWLSVAGALGFNDTELLDFPIGLCESDRQNTDGDDDPRCDLTGGPLPRAPKWNISVAPRLTWPIASIPGLDAVAPLRGIDLGGGLSVEWLDTQFLRESLDPRTREESFFHLNSSIGLSNPERGWRLTFHAENLTNKSVGTVVSDVATTEDTFVQSVRPPRLMFAEFRWDF